MGRATRSDAPTGTGQARPGTARHGNGTGTGTQRGTGLRFPWYLFWVGPAVTASSPPERLA